MGWLSPPRPRAREKPRSRLACCARLAGEALPWPPRNPARISSTLPSMKPPPGGPRSPWMLLLRGLSTARRTGCDACRGGPPDCRRGDGPVRWRARRRAHRAGRHGRVGAGARPAGALGAGRGADGSNRRGDRFGHGCKAGAALGGRRAQPCRLAPPRGDAACGVARGLPSARRGAQRRRRSICPRAIWAWCRHASIPTWNRRSIKWPI